MYFLTDDFTSAENRKTYNIAIDKSSLTSKTKAYLKVLLDHLLEKAEKGKRTQRTELDKLLQEKFKGQFDDLDEKKNPSTDHLKTLGGEIQKFHLRIDRNKGLLLVHEAPACAIVLFRVDSGKDPGQIINHLKKINNLQGEKQIVLGEGVKIRNASLVMGDYDIVAWIEGPSSEIVFRSILKIDSDQNIGRHVRTITLPTLRRGRWVVYEPDNLKQK